MSLFQAVLWIIGLQFTQHVFDLVVSYHNQSMIQNIVYSLMFVGIIKVCEEIVSGIKRYLLSKNSYSNMGKFMVDFQQKLGKIEAIHFEHSQFLDRINRAKECLEYESLGHFASNCLHILGYYSILIVLTGWYLYNLYPPLVFIVLFAFIPSCIGRVLQIKYANHLEEMTVSSRRQAHYYKKTIVDRQYFKETRLLGGFHFFHTLYKQSIEAIVRTHWKCEKKLFILQLTLSIVAFIGLSAAVGLLVVATLDQEISIGAFASVFVALSQLFSLMDELVMNKLDQFGETYVQVANFYRLMDMEEASNQKGDILVDKGIEANGVFFKYPDNKNMTLKGIHAHIETGKTYALVGENGSGKSTFVRLLLGLYAPKHGQINLFGLDTSCVLGSHLYSSSSAVFQHFQHYQMSLQDNVWISKTTADINVQNIKKALEKSQFKRKISGECMLSPEFSGIDLSKGEWQRVAIARALYREHELIVLDEPTSAIDPIEEVRLFYQFKNMTKNKTALIVTHRLASAKYADEIIVMSKGKIVEKGTHQQLMALNGVYCHMWKSQEHWYV
ncbi:MULTISPECIES: ABC transporter ATP-binding protein [unclassified Granulicatella]|uniref:ATP-binding cassette domain-containing protein n=1 Tax=unclassified Granulicatella TaxID=2630493 RepID=UPI00142FC7FD|nr:MULTISPECIES: ABC transporter ATP-binding protein [unclassified Granulicatella]MBF0780648.1 ABC transporter ATP-binding protein [Granulicatella sp. 19428wC4_WM01]